MENDESKGPIASEYRAFKQQADGGELAQQRADALRTHLDDWMAQLPEDRRDHNLLFGVECRVDACLVLLAQNAIRGYTGSQKTYLAEARWPNEALGSFSQEQWWQELRLTYQSSVTWIENDGFAMQMIDLGLRPQPDS